MVGKFFLWFSRLSNYPLLCLFLFLVEQGTLVVSDCLNHMSIVSGCRAAGAHIRVFKHNDAADLEAVRQPILVHKIAFSDRRDSQ